MEWVAPKAIPGAMAWCRDQHVGVLPPSKINRVKPRDFLRTWCKWPPPGKSTSLEGQTDWVNWLDQW